MELYFKSLLQKKVREHELKLLFNRLPEEIRGEIDFSVNSQLAKSYCRKSFKEYLENLNLVFIDWRYIHEQDFSGKYKFDKINEYLQFLKILLP